MTGIVFRGSNYLDMIAFPMAGSYIAIFVKMLMFVCTLICQENKLRNYGNKTTTEQVHNVWL